MTARDLDDTVIGKRFNPAAKEIEVSLAAGGDAKSKRNRCHEMLLAPLNVEVSDWEAFSNRLRSRPLGDAYMTMIDSEACQVRTTVEYASQPGRTGFHIHQCLSGTVVFEQEGVLINLKPGDAVVVDNTRVNRFAAADRHRHLVLQLDLTSHDLDLLTAVGDAPWVLGAATSCGAAATHLMRASWKCLPRLAPSAGQTLLTSLTTLFVEGLAEQASGTDVGTAHARAMLRRARMLIVKNIGDLAFTPKALAERLGVSSRYLGDLFLSMGVSPGDHIHRVRLHAAWDRLTASDYSGSIEQLAFETGFRHPSYFARAVKSAYGWTPREIRRHGLTAARTQGPN